MLSGWKGNTYSRCFLLFAQQCVGVNHCSWITLVCINWSVCIQCKHKYANRYTTAGGRDIYLHCRNVAFTNWVSTEPCLTKHRLTADFTRRACVRLVVALLPILFVPLNTHQHQNNICQPLYKYTWQTQLMSGHMRRPPPPPPTHPTLKTPPLHHD